MRIIGGQDYYDSARAYGEDPDTVLVRKHFDDADVLPRKDTPLRLPWDPRIRGIADRWWSSAHKSIREYRGSIGADFTSGVTIFFAGRAYFGIHVENHSMHHYFWTEDSYETWLAQQGWEIHRSTWKQEKVDEVWSPPRDLDRRELDWCVAGRVGIAILDPVAQRWLHRSEVELVRINCDGLKERGFPRLLDPYQAYQELSMFVGGVLPRTPNPMVEIKDEKVVVGKKGMDKWSFRRPGKKGMY